MKLCHFISKKIKYLKNKKKVQKKHMHNNSSQQLLEYNTEIQLHKKVMLYGRYGGNFAF